MTKLNERLTRNQKNSKNKAWYREKVDYYDNQGRSEGYGFGGVAEKKRMKVNYDLFNNILDLSDFEYVCKPFGSQVGELPAQMVNRDIVSGKIKVLLGMEMRRPLSWRIAATNPSASTRRSREEAKQIREYVVNNVMLGVRQEIELERQEELQGRELTAEERQQVMSEIEQEMQTRTPEEVKRYMERDHKDVAEVMSHQLIEYLFKKVDLARKFNVAFKHGLLSALQVMYVGIINGHPDAWNVNSMNITHDSSPDIQFIEDGEWVSCVYNMGPSQIIRSFGEELTNKEIDAIYEAWNISDDDLDLFVIDETLSNEAIPVTHAVWKSLRKIGFLTFEDEEGYEREIVVDESYEFNPDGGDIDLEWEWIPEVYEAWKIHAAEPIYVNMRPVPGQYKDLNNLYHCSLPYKGVIYDNMNSDKTALMDRLKIFQYYYDIVMYRIELLLASDKGKKVMMNINMIPDSAGIDIKKWQYFMESTPYMWYDPSEEGTYAEAGSIAKEIDLSLASDINKYIEIAEYLRVQAGRSVGITEQVEGQIGADEAVRNTQQAIIQSAHILEPYFKMHDYMKRNVLQALLETAKVAYSINPPEALTYVLDDLSLKTLELDVGLLESSTLGIFMVDSSETEEVRETIRMLSHAALQNQMLEMSDIINVIKQTSVTEAEESLLAAEQKRREAENAMQEKALQDNEKARQAEAENSIREHQQELEKIIVKEEERRKTEIIKSSLIGASFNPDLDENRDGINDFLAIAKTQMDVELKSAKQALDRERFEHQKETDKENIKLKKEQMQQKKKQSQ